MSRPDQCLHAWGPLDVFDVSICEHCGAEAGFAEGKVVEYVLPCTPWGQETGRIAASRRGRRAQQVAV